MLLHVWPALALLLRTSLVMSLMMSLLTMLAMSDASLLLLVLSMLVLLLKTVLVLLPLLVLLLLYESHLLQLLLAYVPVLRNVILVEATLRFVFTQIPQVDLVLLCSGGTWIARGDLPVGVMVVGMTVGMMIVTDL